MSPPSARESLKSAAILGGALVAIIAAATGLVVSAQSPPAGAPRSSGAAPSAEASSVIDSVASATETPPAPVATAPSPAVRHPSFDVDTAMGFIEDMESFGPRRGGSTAERRCAEYIAGELRAMGYVADITEFSRESGISCNVRARLEGSGTGTIILGAHMDSKPPAPGANDNLSGCGVLLETARVLATFPVAPTVDFVFFGSEEMADSDPDHHHYGSRAYVDVMSREAFAETAGMISVDMVGYGDEFVVRTMNDGPQSLRKMLLKSKPGTKLDASFLADPGESGWSDHEPFELAGIPAAWIEWREDTTYHTKKDVSAHLQPKRVRATGEFLLDFLRRLDQEDLNRLLDSSTAG